MTTARVFINNFGITTMRAISSVIALLAFAIVVLIGAEISAPYYGSNEELVSAINTLSVLVGLLAFYLIQKSVRSRYRKKQIIRTIYAFQNNHFIKKGMKTKDVVNERFSVSSVFAMIIKSIKLLGVMVFRHKDKSLVAERKREWFKNLCDFLACFLTGIVPILGFCSLAWYLGHPDDGILKGACDGLYGIFINKKRLIKRMLFVFIVEVVIIIVMGIGLCILIAYLAQVSETVDTILREIGKGFEESNGNYATFAMAMLVVIIEIFVIWVYVQSYGMTSVLQVYSAATMDNPPGTAPVYVKIMETYEKLKARWSHRTT